MMMRTAILALVLAGCGHAKLDTATDSIASAIPSTPIARPESAAAPPSVPTNIRPDTGASGAGGGNTPVDDSASMSVCVEQRGDTSVYHYEVTNGPRALLRVFQIGLGTTRTQDVTDNPDGGGELHAEPPGVTEADGALRIRPPGAHSPRGWHVEWQRVEETSGHLLEWYADSNKFGIAPREARGGYSIAIPGGDSSYASAHWTLLVDAPRDYTGRLHRVPCR